MLNSPICQQHARLWPRELLFWAKSKKGRGQRFAGDLDIFEKSGVYVLYRGAEPYYIGQAQRLWSRLWSHARADARYGHLWTHFNAYVVPTEYLDVIEGLLISASPTANSAKPKLDRRKLPRQFRKELEKKMAIGVDGLTDFDDEGDGPEE